MRSIGVSMLLLMMGAPTVLTAQEAPTGQDRASRPMPPFISPVGKPYRSASGEPYAKAAWFTVLDRDSDGIVIAADFVAEAETFFAELDSDGDGRIAFAEVTHYETVVAPEVQTHYLPPGVDGIGPPPGASFPSGGRAGGPPPGGPPGGMGGGPPPGIRGGPPKALMKKLANLPEGAARFAILGMPQPLLAADQNMNGAVTRDELRAAARERFGWLDALGNGDGRLTWDEIPEAPVEKMMKMPKKGKKKKDKAKDDDTSLPGRRQPFP